MAMTLDRIDAVPLAADEFSDEFKSWLSVLVDSLNSIVNTIEENIYQRNLVTGTTQNIVLNNAYIPTNVAQTLFQLPDDIPFGAVVEIIGQGSGGWKIVTGAGQTIYDITNSAGTSIASAEQYDCISITCTVANTSLVCTSSKTTGFTYV